MNEWILNNISIIFFWLVIGICLLYIFIRVVAFGATKSFLEARRDYYENLKNKLHKKNKGE